MDSKSNVFLVIPGYTVWNKCYKPNDRFENYTETTYVRKLLFVLIKYLNNYTGQGAHIQIVFSFEWRFKDVLAY